MWCARPMAAITPISSSTCAGMILFIASEVMFFVAWFWAGSTPRSSPRPPNRWASQPPHGMHVLNPFGFPLLNTFILLCSGTTVTWAHHALINGHRRGLIEGLWCTIALGLLFTSIQAYEYSHAPFGFKDNIYTSTFFMATGFHGFHVIVGTIFLTVCLVRSYKGHFTPQQHFGFEAAAWYWHFVDVVWLFLFLCIYVWGGWEYRGSRLTGGGRDREGGWKARTVKAIDALQPPSRPTINGGPTFCRRTSSLRRSQCIHIAPSSSPDDKIQPVPTAR